jgi:hypothetical protein
MYRKYLPAFPALLVIADSKLTALISFVRNYSFVVKLDICRNEKLALKKESPTILLNSCFFKEHFP